MPDQECNKQNKKMIGLAKGTARGVMNVVTRPLQGAFEFVDNVKSKNINQYDESHMLDLITIDYLKNNDNYEINLIFSNNAHISLSTEIIEVTLDDQNKADQ